MASLKRYISVWSLASLFLFSEIEITHKQPLAELAAIDGFPILFRLTLCGVLAPSFYAPMAPLGTLAADLLGGVLSVLLLPIDERMSSITTCGSWVHIHQAVRGPNVIWSSLGPVCNLAAIYFNIDVFLSK